jgi:hypothetical protein
VTHDEIKDEPKIEADARRFFLGDMAEHERDGFEANFIENQELFDRLSVVEDELIESYVRDTLAAGDRQKFEQNFLVSKRRRERVEFTRGLIGKLGQEKKASAVKKTETAAAAQNSVWRSITDFLRAPAFAFSAAAILLAVLGGWFLLRNPAEPNVAVQATPTPAPTPRPVSSNSIQPEQTNQNLPANTGPTPGNINGTNKNKPAERQETPLPAKTPSSRADEPRTVNPVLALFTGALRSEGKTNELNLPANAGNVLLQLNLPSQDYKIYRAEIVTPDGKTVARAGNLRPNASKINLTVPAAKLSRGDYIVKLSALNPQNEPESVADFTFRVNPK